MKVAAVEPLVQPPDDNGHYKPFGVRLVWPNGNQKQFVDLNHALAVPGLSQRQRAAIKSIRQMEE